MNASPKSVRSFLARPSVSLISRMAIVVTIATGCTKPDSEVDQPYAASGGVAPVQESSGKQSPAQQPGGQPPVVAAPLPVNVPPANSESNSKISQRPMNDAVSRPAPAMPTLPQGEVPREANVPFKVSAADQTVTAESSEATPQLRADLTPNELVKVLSSADQDMQLIFSGQAGLKDEREARTMLFQIVSMKLEASRRLLKHPEADGKQKSEGARGELQSLSHFASLGDLKAAQELEELAEANLQSNDPKVAADSRLVLVGFAIESLQNGKEGSVARILDYTKQIAESTVRPDVSAMVILGEARHVLAAYGNEDEARKVRDTIIDLFGNSSSPEIADMAAKLAGTVRFDAIDRLRAVVMDGEPISISRWRESVETLIDESADLQTVRYLSGAALDFESLGNMELVDATHEILSTRFTKKNSATATEVGLAIESRKARQKVIGRDFDFDLPDLQGNPLSLRDHRGKVILMPFWATAFPESLKVVGLLKEIRDLDPKHIEIVGVNLDAEGTDLEPFLEVNELGFPSFRSEAPPSAANSLAVEFGMVSMPFVAIVDQDGKIAGISFYGRNLKKTVDSLLTR